MGLLNNIFLISKNVRYMNGYSMHEKNIEQTQEIQEEQNKEKTLEELKIFCQRSLMEWSHCWGFTECSSLSEFMPSLSLVS